MCGIFGIVGKFTDEKLNEMISRGHAVQKHRGPDMNGSSILNLEDGYRLALGHQRLSILDLSTAGRQPMVHESGKSTICYNGEVYNYVEIAEKINMKLEGQSDTAVILESFNKLGFTESLKIMNGMWSFIYYDDSSKQVMVCRDRAGEKPLYYTSFEGGIIIASELKTILAITNIKFELNHQVIAEYIEQSLQDTSTETLFKDIHTLKASHYGNIELNSDRLIINETCYWKPNREESQVSESDAIANIKNLVQDAIKIRLRSDVPIGITISGGVDSSINAAVMTKLIPPSNIHAYSSIAPGQQGDESKYINIISEGLKISTNCLDLTWNPEETVSLMKKVTWHNDAPLGSFSNILFYRLMESARAAGLKVIISGQGADEVFCGYKKYFFWSIQEDLKKFKFIKVFKNVLSSIFNGTVIHQFNINEARRYINFFKRKNSILSNNVLKNFKPVVRSKGNIASRQWDDIARFSVPYLTHYEDRASMAHAVEVRLPFLDHRVIEAGLALSKDLKLKGPWTKYVLRKAFQDIVPKENIWRTDKQGFTNPQEDLMRGSLKETIQEVFNSNALIFKLNLIDKNSLDNLWQLFLNKESNVWYREVFAPWALEVWLQEFKEFIKIED